MGLFDKIKNIANQVTGGGAKVSIIVEGTSVKEKIKVNVTAVVKDAPLPIEKVYLYVRSVERINISRDKLPGGSDKNPQNVSLDHDVFNKQEFVVSPAQTLDGGKTYNWTYEVSLPENATPSYTGKYANHEWQFYVGLDAKGNDPDSGWVTVTLK
ncbi:MAG: hypothetical protein Q8L81_18020 [Bacteroidota bacterium]|nr:hypothetical protein [Bacteroidota bacterium]